MDGNESVLFNTLTMMQTPFNHKRSAMCMMCLYLLLKVEQQLPKLYVVAQKRFILTSSN